MTKPANQPDKFFAFLSDKGFPKDSIIEYPIKNIGQETDSDIVIKDPISKRHLAIIDRRSEKNFDIIKSSKQLMNYGKSIATPIYVVVYNSTDFNIYGLENSGLVPITKLLFPTYDTLIEIAQENYKQHINDIRIKTLQNDEAKKKGFITFAISTVSIFMVAISATFIFDSVISPSEQEIKKKHQLNIEQYKDTEAKLNSLIQKFNKLSISSVAKADTIIYIDSSKTYKGLEKRLMIIEKGISESPEKALAIVNIKNELLLIRQGISEIEANNAIRNEYIQKQIDSTMQLANTTLFLLIGSLLSAVVGILMAFKPDFFKRKSPREVTISRTEPEW